MIVHDGGEVWQVVLQTDHADLAGAFARAWGNEQFEVPVQQDAMVIAGRRHDDGWAVWERSPRVVDGQRPIPFLEVHITSHLAFYDAAIVDVTDDDAYAGLMCAMHGAGLYRERYGTQPGLRNRWADDYGTEIEAFVAKMEASFPQRIAELGVSEEERWANYRLLQAFDRLSLYFSGLFPIGRDDEHRIAPVPTDYAGGETELTIVPVADFAPLTPVRVRMDPFPFAERPARFTLKRHVLEKSEVTSESFPALIADRRPEEVEVVVE